MTVSVVPVSQATEPGTATPDTARYALALIVWAATVTLIHGRELWAEMPRHYRAATIIGVAAIVLATVGMFL